MKTILTIQKTRLVPNEGVEVCARQGVDSYQYVAPAILRGRVISVNTKDHKAVVSVGGKEVEFSREKFQYGSGWHLQKSWQAEVRADSEERPDARQMEML